MDIPDIDQAWNDMVNSGEMFGKDFENAWEWYVSGNEKD
jgi:hypothetical protein